MYKVFVNDCPIILTDNSNISTNFEEVNFNDANINKIVEQLFNSEIVGVNIICENLEQSWSSFTQNFKVQKAAGGKVLDSHNQILFIYRFDKWDLPKGKLEKGETLEQCALREVEEECGINMLNIEKPLETTYHIFKRNNETILKVSYWYLMTTNFAGDLIPQSEEGIEKVEFKNKTATEKALLNTYETIKLLF